MSPQCRGFGFYQKFLFESANLWDICLEANPQPQSEHYKIHFPIGEFLPLQTSYGIYNINFAAYLKYITKIRWILSLYKWIIAILPVQILLAAVNACTQVQMPFNYPAFAGYFPNETHAHGKNKKRCKESKSSAVDRLAKIYLVIFHNKIKKLNPVPWKYYHYY